MGEWVPITIDDYIPCFYKSVPMFTRCSTNEIWPFLIEKAYAKLFGNYSALTNGDAAKALFDLTGMPVSRMVMNGDEEEVFERIQDELERG
jgi:hypothetical protein